MTKEHDDFRKKLADAKNQKEEQLAIENEERKILREKLEKERELAKTEAKIKEEENKTILKEYDDLLKPFFEIVRDEHENANDAVIKSELRKLLPGSKPQFFDRSYSHSPEVERFEHDNDCFDGEKYNVYIYSPLSYHIEMLWDYEPGGYDDIGRYTRRISTTILIDYVDPISKKLIKNGNLIVDASECSGIITLLRKKIPLFYNPSYAQHARNIKSPTYYYEKGMANWKIRASLNDPDWQEKITDEILKQLDKRSFRTYNGGFVSSVYE